MVDNFENIYPLFYFNEANNMFFHLQIVARAKDHKNDGMKVKEGAIKTYFVRSREHLAELKDEIVMLCEHYGARAYINVAGKDFSELNKILMFKLAQDQLNNVIGRNPRKLMNSAAGELKSRCKRWVVDIDDVSQIGAVLDWMDKYFHVGEYNPDECNYIHMDRDIYLTATLPTKSGIHLITQSFNVKEFNEVFPDVMVHKNSMGTVLYSPKSID